MELRYYFDILRRRFAFVGLVVIVGLLGAWLITPREPVYRAESTIYVGFSTFTVGDEGEVTFDRLATIDRLLITFSRMVTSRPVAQDAVAELDLARSPDAVVNQTKAATDPGTQLLVIQVDDPDPALARDLANALAQAFTDRITDLEGGSTVSEELDTGELPSGLPAYVYELATIPSAPVPDGLIRNLMLGFSFSLLIACGVVFLLEYLDLTVKNAEDTERRTELPVLGVIPRFDKPYAPLLSPAHAPRGAVETRG